jgi:hypothetical protein
MIPALLALLAFGAQAAPLVLPEPVKIEFDVAEVELVGTSESGPVGLPRDNVLLVEVRRTVQVNVGGNRLDGTLLLQGEIRQPTQALAEAAGEGKDWDDLPRRKQAQTERAEAAKAAAVALAELTKRPAKAEPPAEPRPR